MSRLVPFENIRFGRVEAQEEEIIHFPGLPGFPEARRFVFRGHDCGTAFGWMVCVDDPGLAFVVADPAQAASDYAPALPSRTLRALGARSGEELDVVLIATIADGAAWLNLAAPVVVHRKARCGVQVILDPAEHPRRAPLDLRAKLSPVDEHGGSIVSAGGQPALRADPPG